MLGASAVAASGSSSAGGASPHYVFTFKQGLNAAQARRGDDRVQGALPQGDAAAERRQRHLLRARLGRQPEAQKAHKADVELYCGEKPRITEVHFASSAFCSCRRHVHRHAGQPQKFAAELKAAGRPCRAWTASSGSGKCTSLYGIYDLTNVEITLGQLPRRYTSLAAIGPQCVASTVLIYREAPQHLSP